MVYRKRVLLIFPLILAFAFWAVVHYDYLKLWIASIASVSALLIYLLIVSIIAGLFHHPHAKSASRGPFIYYYKALQGQYWTVPGKFFALFNSADLSELDGKAQYIAFYWDDPCMIEDANQCRSIMGFAVPKEKSNKKAIEILEKVAGLTKVELPEWKSVEASMRIIINLTYMIAPMKLMPVLFEYAVKHYPEQERENGPIYEMCDGNYSTYGFVLGASSAELQKLKPLPDPKLKQGIKPKQH